MWALAWGLVQEQPSIDNYQGQPLAEVEVNTNLGYTLLTVLTLGTVSPANVRWRCAKAQADATEIGDSSSAERPPEMEEGEGHRTWPPPVPSVDPGGGLR